MATKSILLFEDTGTSNGGAGSDHYHTLTISDLNSKMLSGFAANCYINSVTLKVTTHIERSGNPKVYLKCWFCPDDKSDYNSGTNLMTVSEQIPKTSTVYTSDVTSHFSRSQPWSANTSYARFSAYYEVAYVWAITFYCKAELVVDYTPLYYTLTVQASPADGGTFGGFTGTDTYGYREICIFKATANTGYKFVKWENGSTEAERSVQILGNTVCTAYFEKLNYTISTAVSPSGCGSVSGAGTYPYLTSVTLKAAPITGYKFVKWDDGNTSAERTVSVSGAKTYTAYFEKLTYTVTWKNGSTTLETDYNVSHGTTPTYNGATPTKNSDAQYTYTFSGWSPAVGAISGNTTYTAQFTSTLRQYTITTMVSPAGCGTVSGGGSHNYGATPTLTASAAKDYKFVKWQDGVTTASRTITVTGAATYTAYFELDKIKNVYRATTKQDVYRANSNIQVYKGTTKIYG